MTRAVLESKSRGPPVLRALHASIMSVLKRPFLLGFFGASLALLMDSTPAASLVPSGWEKLSGCAERVKSLTAEVEMLRGKLAAREARVPSSNVKRLPDYAALPLRREVDCTVPFVISRRGIKRYKDGCEQALSVLSPCEPPYELDARGVKNFKPGCLPSQ